MKKIWLPIVCSALCLNLFAAGQMDGERIHRLTLEFATPHLDWAETLPQGKLKVLFVVALDHARYVVETAQRMPLDYETVTTAIRFPNFGITADDDTFFGNCYTGTSQTAKGEELLRKLETRYDVIALDFQTLEQIPAQAVLKIFSQTKAGAGLIFYQTKGQEKYKSLFATPAPAGKQSILALAGLSPEAAKGFAACNTFTFGQGRVVNAGAMIVAPFKYDSPRWWAEFENAEVVLMRTLLWAAGRQPQIAIRIPELEKKRPVPATLRELPVEIESPKAGKLALRLRDEFNKVIRTDTFAFDGSRSFRYPLPALRSGRYYLDVMAGTDQGTDNLGVFRFEYESGFTAELATDRDAVREFDPIRATLSLNQPVPGGRAVVSFIDSPYERVWYRAEIKLGDSTRIPIEVKDYTMPTLAAFLVVEVFQGETPVALADRTLFFPVHNQKLPPYPEFVWEYNPGASDRLRSMAENDAMGNGGVFCRIDGDRPSVQSYMLLNQRLGSSPANVGLTLQKSDTGNEFQYVSGPLKHLSAEENAILASMKGRFSIGNPNAEAAERVVVRDAIRNKALDQYPLAYYQLGNEVNVSYEGGFGPDDQRAFLDLLKARYDTIGKLNTEWGRSFKSFAEVPNLPMNEAKNKGLYPEYLAHRRLVDSTVLQRFAVIADELKKTDPFARIGCDGVWSLSNGGFNMEEILANPNIGYWEHYNQLPRAEILRSLRPDMFYGFIWGWTMSNEALPEAPWFNLLTNCGHHGSWFISGCSVGGQQLAADYRPFRPRMAEELEKLRTGVAQLLLATPLAFDGLAIWESYNSNVAAMLGDPRMPSSNDSVMPLIAFSYQNGINFDFLVRRTLAAKLTQYKVLFLAGATSISADEERQMLAFVQGGGTIIADFNPGIMNDSFGFLPENRLAPLFGKLDSRVKPAPGPIKVAVELNGRPIALDGAGVNTIPGVPPFTIRKHGKGQAVLLNFTLGAVRDVCDKAAYNQFLRDLLAACGITATVTVADLPPESIVRRRQGNGFDLVGVTNRQLASAGKGGGDLTLTFPRRGYIYEVGKGPIGHSETARLTLDPAFKLVSMFTTEQKPPVLRLSGQVARPGTPLIVDLGSLPAGRVMCLQIRDAAGKLINPRSEAFSREVFEVDRKQPKRPVHFAYNAPRGDYELTLTDVATGLAGKAKVALE